MNPSEGFDAKIRDLFQMVIVLRQGLEQQRQDWKYEVEELKEQVSVLKAEQRSDRGRKELAIDRLQREVEDAKAGETVAKERLERVVEENKQLKYRNGVLNHEAIEAGKRADSAEKEVDRLGYEASFDKDSIPSGSKCKNCGDPINPDDYRSK